MPFSYYENLPRNWENVSLGMLCWLENRKRTEGRELPYLDTKTLRGSADKAFISNGIALKNGEKAILVDGENSGEVFAIPYDGYMGSTFKLLSFSNYINQDYILLIIRNYKELLKNNKTGSAIPHLNKNIFNSLPVGLPPLEEQNRICEVINKLFTMLDAIEQSLN